MTTQIPTISKRKELYLKEHPYDYNVFVMMKYGQDKYHALVEDNVRRAFRDVGLYNPVFAKDLTPYFPTLADAIRQSIDMCPAGIAIFTPQEGTQFNPNVAFEVGIMWGEQKKDLLILKDSRMPNLFTNVTELIHKEFGGELKNLRPVDNLLYKTIKRWLEVRKEIQLNSGNVVFVTGLENIIENPSRAIDYFEEQMWRCIKTIAQYAHISIPESADLRTAIKLLYDKHQITAFIRLVMHECIRSCQQFRGVEQLSVEQREQLLGWASLIRDIYNDWLRHYGNYLSLKKRQ